MTSDTIIQKNIDLKKYKCDIISISKFERNYKMKKILLFMVSISMIIALTACTLSNDFQEEDTMKENAIVTIQVKDYGTMVVELNYEAAPNTVTNFVNLAQEGFYDGLDFHRIISGFMIQGGGANQPPCTIKGEFSSNGFDNPLNHERGVISMARTQVKDSATSQFFIMHQDNAHLDGDYAAFGKLIEGFDVLDMIAMVETDAADRPRNKVIIESVTVDTLGESYEETECVS